MVDSHDTQAVQFAASEGQLECMSEILEYLKQRGLLNESIPIMERALFKSCGRGTWEIARLLSQYGLEVESAVELKSGLTALHTAAAQGCLEIMVWLIEQGADIDIKDKDMGWTALFYAAKNGYGDCVDLLLTHGANINQTDEQGKTAGFYAAYEGHHAISCKLIPTISDSTMSSMQLEDFIPDLELPPPVIPYYRREYSQNLRTKQLVVRLKILDKATPPPAPSHDEFASKYLNIKVQLTKDLVPVIYKDDLVLVNESIGLYLPICALTYSELSKLLRNDPSVFPKFGFLKAASQEFTTTRYLSERLALGSSGYPLEKALTEMDERIGLNIEVYSGTSHSADETMTCCYGNKNLAVDMILKTLLPFSCSSQALIDAGDQLLGERGYFPGVFKSGYGNHVAQKCNRICES
ncbi:Ankyrin repeat protein nuc-2 [Zancudomyces culisetae]|uniref:Ankyrin repeat protein nuc-2 n=1 Tax=Zancudomyces culisetae TaxID=1213189 RepID=A0A1R1PVB5_ZANCU|nr:Ankyrin repeat protein nuc-2 [Zancudomyces culisetae]|eukprot:OMH84898.1 Ankyrin repeat protein nuc-2 [Zancudomyces culisetae]